MAEQFKNSKILNDLMPYLTHDLLKIPIYYVVIKHMKNITVMYIQDYLIFQKKINMLQPSKRKKT